jgi:3-oxoacyl-[acyl-carrier protein] reductase
MLKVLITGGNKGIGFATTTCFLQHGYDIVIVARDFSAFPLQETRGQQVCFDLRHYRDIPR